ncbi:DUF2971 domain-containing protein [Pseudomonas sp. lyk4-R2A-10]|uniref:DUF2971 domain-containing protein n=1 Tax=Pseudomonas sp. lyk4-R2A-10 TaxID=3040315 RepID=UPI0025563956|nr:DUF2971 domain-containing protein [Pseudomonas sp. lyk4-R2A-10]
MEKQIFVYHYTTARTAIDYILRNMSLRLGRLGGVNDPKESKFRDFVFYARGPKAISDFEGVLFDDACDDLANNSYALCCGVAGANDRDREDGALHPHMWANYAGRHTGVCLVLDKDALHKKVVASAGSNTLFYGEVEYHDFAELSKRNSPAYSLYLEDWLKDKEGYFDFHVNNYNRQMFFLKHEDWCVENEIRWVIRSRVGADFFVDISDALVKVVVGHDVSEPDFHYLRERCVALGVPIHKVIWNSSGSLSADLSTENVPETLDMNFMFSRQVPCSAIFHRVSDGRGNPKVIAVSSRNGNVVYCGKGDDSHRSLKPLGYTEAEAAEGVSPRGFSAGRLAEIGERPLNGIFKDGVFYGNPGEEVPFYENK